MPEETQKDICEICHEEIIAGLPQIRIVADAMVANGPADYTSLIDNKVLVFAVFHASCLHETSEDTVTDEVPYVWEARSLLEMTEISASPCDKKVVRPRPSHLRVLQGGLR